MARRRKGKRRKSRGGFFSAPRRAGRRRGRARRRVRRGNSLGWAGKFGIGVAVGAPVLGTVLETAADLETLVRTNQSDPPSPLGLARVGFWNALNHVTAGFGGGTLRGSLSVTMASGALKTIHIGSAIPAGTWFKTALPGAFLVGWDIMTTWAKEKFAKVRGSVKLLGFRVTGGRG